MLSPESWQPALDEFIKKFATSFVVPCMERKVRTLHGENTALVVQPKRLNAARSGQATQSEVIGAIVVEESPCLLHGL